MLGAVAALWLVQVLAIVSLYYLRVTRRASLAMSDAIVLWAPSLLVAVIVFLVLRAFRSQRRQSSARFLLDGFMAMAIAGSGLAAALIIALNRWGS